MNFLPFGRAASSPLADTRAEQQRIAEAVVRSAAGLVSSEADADAILHHQCLALTALAPHVVLAWTWFGPADTQTIRPQVMAGAAADYARTLVIERNRLTEMGPAFRTLAGRKLEPFGISSRSLFGPWRDVAARHGVRSVLALPLVSSFDDRRGLFVLYADAERYFEQVGVGLFEALAHLFSAVLSRTARIAELRLAAHCDPLTGLSNRKAIRLIEGAMQRLSDRDPPCAVLMIDIDHFKRINDVHGHAAGDAALCGVARLLQASLRPGDTVMRWGGEEFLVCLPRTGLDAGLRVADKLRATLEGGSFALTGGRHLQLTASIGVADLRVDESLDAVIERADAALYAAKKMGRNRAMTG